MSLERKLPLLMTLLVAAVLGLGLFLARSELTASTERSATERMTRAARGIAAGTETAIHERNAEIHAVVARASLPAAIARRDSAALGRVLRALRISDTALALEVWDEEGVAIASTGRPFTNREREAAFGARLARFPLPWTRPDSISITPMYPWGDSVYFWRVLPVTGRDGVAGHLALQSRVVSPESGLRMMRDLLGDHVTLHIRNDVGGVWVQPPGRPMEAPRRRDATRHAVYHTHADGERTLAAEVALAGTPWHIVLSVPAEVVLAPVTVVLWRFALGGVVLATVAAVIAWLVSRRIARPLTAITAAAEGIARGRYDQRVRIATGDEVERLGAAFNRMADDIGGAQQALERRTREAETARGEAERANRAKSDFLAVMSHELRTPLNAINGYAELLKLGVYGPLSPKQDEALQRISRNQDHLLSLINSILNFARIEGGQLEFDIRPVAVGEVVAALEPLVAPQLLARRLVFTVHRARSEAGNGADVVALADPDKVRQILLNLLANAIKFTAPGGRVDIRYERAGETVDIRVTDTGIGIPTERLSAIFEPFVQADRVHSRPHDGVGLGLAIGRELARAMGGDVTVSSQVGTGSTFTLTLPAAPEQSRLPGHAAAAIVSSS